MKKQIVLLLATGILFLFFQSFRPELPAEMVIPDEVSTILQTSCYTCHSTGSRAEKALEALNFEEWDNYRVTKKIAVLEELCKVVEEGKMPPERFLERNPDSKLSEAHKKILCDWTRQEADKLLQGD